MKKVFGTIICVLLISLFLSFSSSLEVSAQTIIKPIKAFHFVLRALPLDKAYWMVDEVKKAGYNTIVVQITDGVRLANAPWTPRDDAWSKEDFIAWIKHIDKKGLAFVPEFKFLTHQEKFFQDRFSELMYNSKTYDPQKEDVYQKVFALIDEVIDISQPKAIHIGHDEVAGFNEISREKWLKAGEDVLPAELFFNDVMRLYDYLKKKGIETWMWGDMLIDPDEFPDLPKESKKSFHGTLPGYGKELRAKLPKDIVICDWHYNDEQEAFPSLTTFQKEGFRVIGATWVKEKTIKNFSRYAAKNNAYGMMATTWWHVQKRNWDIVDKIIKISGDTFSKDFTNGK